MKKMTCFLLCLLIGAAFGAIPARADTMNTVKGTISDKNTGQPIADVRITIVPARGQAQHIELVSGGDGTVYKNGILTGSYEVRFEKEGYFPVRSNIRLTIGDSFDISVKLEPVPAQDAGGAALLRGVVELVNAGQFAAGIEKASAALEKEPSDPMLHYYRGYGQEKSGNAVAAIADYGRAVALKPDFALALTSLGKLLARQGDYAQAAEQYKKSLAIAPNDPDSLYNYGACLVNMGDNDGAGQALVKLLAIDPGHADGCYQLGIVRLGQGEMAKAREYLQKFLELDPQHKDAAIAKQILESIK